MLGHPCFWEEVPAILYAETETKSRNFRTVSVKIQLIYRLMWLTCKRTAFYTDSDRHDDPDIKMTALIRSYG